MDAKIVESYTLGFVRGVQFMSGPGEADEKEIKRQIRKDFRDLKAKYEKKKDRAKSGRG